MALFARTCTLGQLAVEAYRAALEVRTRENLPVEWATTQYNLGLALANLGEREQGTERLELAVTAWQAALGVWTRDFFVDYHGIATKNIEIAKASLRERS